ncbi:M48 family metallopeptidase [Mongoliitalea lutea]|uniref:Hydrolase n=1 Tax=Mongoliitalea lutea TaxID=849756 RepID=A0A8J3CVR4_9BACT|nr:SprT family zinc-dependent metalloprotease [Mongoliitalea lutea]GHB33830.1 hydrolase [Mongoliitalea lutea]
MKQTIVFGSRTIDFHLEYSDRKSLGITVTPDMEVIVKAPYNTGIDKIKEKIRKKAPWVIKQQSYFLSFHPKTPQRKYISGETHLYLGRQYRLLINNDELGIDNERVKLEGGFLKVYTLEKQKAESLVKNWYRKKAEQKLKEIASPLIDSFLIRHKLSIPTIQLSIREMPTRWGSCTAKGKIILNPELIKAPKGSIEYVIVHELCYLVYHDHTQKFLDLQTREMKDWKKWKSKLEKILA